MTQAQSSQSIVPAKWDARQIPSQFGKIAIVTGANSGIGYVVARELARKGAHVVLACRTAVNGEDAAKRIREEISATYQDEAVGKVEFMQLDVGSLANVRTFANAFRAKFDRLDLLVNNAGIFAVPYALTVDGFESQFATNHLGHFALAAQLFDLLKVSDASRVVSVSSNAHENAKLIGDEVVPMNQATYSAMGAYEISKLSNMLFTHELSRRLEAHGLSNVMAVAAHPGISRTNVIKATAKKNKNWFRRWLWRLFNSLPLFQDPKMGALPTLYAATASNVRTGQYFGPDGFKGLRGFPALATPSKESKSEMAATKLWSLSEYSANIRFHVN